ncbi:MAG: hypothetical protein KBD76_01080 [Bacteriovorax sp.]|nr:hypothetical protein [Bacteriovorax sp.]
MRNSLFLMASLLLFSCAKEEFAANKGNQSNAISAATTYTNSLCSQYTLIKPKVDILMLWDNSTSSNFIRPETKDSLRKLINNVSDKFDYHVLSVPLISTDANLLNEASLIVSDKSSLSSELQVKAKGKDEELVLAFSKASGGAERGVDRAAEIIQKHSGLNSIFRPQAYTIVVLMSNGDDRSCELSTGYNQCAGGDEKAFLQKMKEKLLCLRGNSDIAPSTCAHHGIPSSLDASMLRFISITPQTLCSEGLNKISSRYSKTSTAIYQSTYTNGWPSANDDLRSTPDAYNLCNGYSNIFDGVNTAIKQTLIKHVYDFWPVAGLDDSLDPDTLRVSRIGIDNIAVDLINNTNTEGTPTSGFKYIGNQNNHRTRLYPTSGEPFTGKMIQLFSPPESTNGAHDQVIYPECLKITYSEIKKNYGYIYLTNGEPHAETIEVRLNGNVIPKSTTNGWDYMGTQFINALDSSKLKIVNFPYDHPVDSGYIIRLNGSAQFTNSSGNKIEVYYTSKSQ